MILPLFFSCTTLSPISGLKENPPPQAKQIEEISPYWQPLAYGMDYFEGRILEPKVEFKALRADLTNPGLKIVVSRGDLSTYVTSFTEKSGCIAGINATPFDPSSDREGEKRTIAGVTISNGELISQPVQRYDALVFYNDKAESRAAIVSQSELSGGLSMIENAVGGFFKVLENGRLSSRLFMSDDPETLRRDLPRASRSAAGLSADGKILYLLVIDGRRTASIGATEAELALLLRQLGCFNGLNLDGGGSSAMALRFPDGKVRAVNTPVHNRIPGNQRAVATCLGIALQNITE